ncbi:MAG: hypothetical protein GX895_08730 [Clostridiales bacterium]|jgi:uncharacterized LabA/DUF88 family protein|nr:hypothetical protein [Clostridiales bacterium]
MSLESLKSFFGEHNESTVEDDPEPMGLILTGKIERENKRYELYKKLDENIRKSEILRSKINHDVKQGADIFSILNDSLKCISLMTGDELFYKSNIETLRKRFKWP